MQVEEPRLGRSIEYLLRGFDHQSARKSKVPTSPGDSYLPQEIYMCLNIKIGAPSTLYLCNFCNHDTRRRGQEVEDQGNPIEEVLKKISTAPAPGLSSCARMPQQHRAHRLCQRGSFSCMSESGLHASLILVSTHQLHEIHTAALLCYSR